MIKAVGVIASNTFREIVRDRILYGLLVFAVLLIAVSLALGQLSFKEQTRIAINFGFSGIHLSLVMLAIFVGSTLVYREIEKQTILTLLARPISRTQFIVGKFIGLSLVIFTAMVLLALVLLFVVLAIGFEMSPSFFIALLGMYFEALILLSFSLLFGTFARPTMSVVFVIGIFLIGHWLDSLNFFAERSKSDEFMLFSKFINTIMPNFEIFNWRAAPVFGDVLSLSEVAFALTYTMGWLMLVLSMTSLSFRRRDFV